MTNLRLVSDNPAPTSQSGDGGGPEDPMLEQRVGRLEEKAERIESRLETIGNDLVEIKVALAKLDGRLEGIGHRFSSLPTTWTMLGIVFTTWALGSGILIFAMNFLKR